MRLTLRHWKEGDAIRAVICLEHAGARVEKGVEISGAVLREGLAEPVMLDVLALRLDEIGLDWEFRMEQILRNPAGT